MEERALALDPEQLPSALDPFQHELLGGAGDEVGDDCVDRDPPPRDRDARLAGRDELAPDPAAPGLGVELERDGHLPDRAVGAHGEHDLPVVREVRAGRGVQARRGLAEIAQLDAVAGGEDAELGVVRDELVEAVLDVEAGRDAGLEEHAPGGREPPAGGRDADERRRRVVGERLLDRADDREALLGLPRPRRVEDRDDLLGPVAKHAARGLPVVRVAGEPLRQDQEPTLAGHRAPVPSRGAGCRSRTRRPARGRRRAGGSRRGRRGRTGSRCGRRRRCRDPTRPCSRA